ncbi:MAG: hypothetical protein ACRBBJ_10125, partial [Rhodomicrobiaceae bacterium]
GILVCLVTILSSNSALAWVREVVANIRWVFIWEVIISLYRTYKQLPLREIKFIRYSLTLQIFL